MNYGMYLSASGVLTNLHRQDVIANNLANASTTAFRRDLASFTQRLPESQENPGAFGLSNDLLDRLGGGTLVRPTETDFRPGRINPTGNDLDLAIAGQGFFAVNVQANGQTDTRITRDGRLTLADNGRLITTANGHELLDTAGQPITLDPSAQVTVDQTGTLRQNGETVAQLKLVPAGAGSSIKHLGNGIYEAPQSLINSDAQGTGSIRQGWLEESNVDPVREMVAMIQTSRAIDNNARLMRFHDVLLERAVNTLGRIPQ
jgi:flagellar basal-body rod protein FlgF